MGAWKGANLTLKMCDFTFWVITSPSFHILMLHIPDFHWFFSSSPSPFLYLLKYKYILSPATKSDLVVFTKRIHCCRTDVAFGKKLVFFTRTYCGIMNTCSFQPRVKVQSPQPWYTVQYIPGHVLYMWRVRWYSCNKTGLPNLTSRGHCILLWRHFLFSG